ncbi:MAG: hypothetical protein ACXQS3_07230 [Candidatus Methanofastidiosia archaeon]
MGMDYMVKLDKHDKDIIFSDKEIISLDVVSDIRPDILKNTDLKKAAI